MIPGGGSIKEYKEVNARESLELADAFLSYNFLNVMPHKKATNPFYRVEWISMTQPLSREILELSQIDTEIFIELF